MNIPSGTILQNGKYRIISVLGQGGFGITYKGTLFEQYKGALQSIPIQIPVAIKEFFFQDYCTRKENSHEISISTTKGKVVFERFREKLIKEAHILAKLDHPNIVKVLEVFEENNTVYMVMEYIEGESLRDILEAKHILPVDKALKYTRQTGEALIHIHGKRILHLDVKPSNILISDAEKKAKLIDFGISKRYDENLHETSITIAGKSKGYAPIEQYSEKGAALFAPSLDVYSLGATLYHSLTGCVPPDPYTIIDEGLTPPSQLNKEIPDHLDQAIQKAMAVKKTDRYQSVNEFLVAMDVDGLDEHEKQGEKKETLPVQTDSQHYPGLTEPVIGSGFITPHTENENLIKKCDQKANYAWVWLLMGIIIIIIGFIMTLWFIDHGPSLNELIEMVYVEGGNFNMGSNDGTDCEKPIHEVMVNSFWIGKYEVTVNLFNEFIKETGYKTDSDKDEGSYIWNNEKFDWEKRAWINWRCDAQGNIRSQNEYNQPVIHVSYNDALAFCNWLNTKTGQKYRLPTEAEWEYAAGNGSKHTKYSWGNSEPFGKKGGNVADEAAKMKFSDWPVFNGYDDGYIYTSPSGSFDSNEFGIYDMSGNVWEWCNDWYDCDYYANSPYSNPQGPSTGDMRAFRGGSWTLSPSDCRVARRVPFWPSFRSNVLGFRLLRTD